jgi:hypothetical protein
MTYKGRNDLWLIAIFAIGTATLFLAGKYWIGGPLLLLLTLCALPQTYLLAADGVYIHAGLVRRFIPYNVITFVGPCGGATSLALTLDGVRLRYGLNSEIRIAPSDAGAFIEDVANRSPHLTKKGQDLVLSLA